MQPGRATFPVDHPHRTEHRFKAITRPSFIPVEVLIIRPLRHIHSVSNAHSRRDRASGCNQEQTVCRDALAAVILALSEVR